MVTVTSDGVPRPLCGIVPPVITPLHRGELDVPALERVLTRLICGGVHALFILGTTGEAFQLERRIQMEMIRQTARIVSGKVPVLVGVMDPCIQNSIVLAQQAASAGASAVVVTPPLLLPTSQNEVIRSVDEMLAGQPLPVFLYHNPALARTDFAPETVATLAERPRILGLKDSSGNLDYFRRAIQLTRRPDFSFLIGAERLLPEAIAAGGHGCVGGGAHIAPRLFVELFDALKSDDSSRIQPLYQSLLALNRLYGTSPSATIIIRRIKSALSLLNIASDEMASPLLSADADERRLVARHLKLLRDWVSAPSTVSVI